MSREYPDLEFIPARWWADGRIDGQPTKIVVHATHNTASARAEALFAARRDDRVSAHYFVDELECVQGVLTSDTAFCALYHGNQDGIQYELCGLSGGTWSPALLKRAARQMARDMRRWNIRAVRLYGRDVRVRARTGIAGHVDFTMGWPEDDGNHTDPGGNFPWDDLLGYITEELGGTVAGDETDATEQRIWKFLDTGERGGNNETGQFPKPGGGTWSRPLNWLKRRLLEIEDKIDAPRLVVLSDEQLVALSENVTDQVVARLGALRFTADGD